MKRQVGIWMNTNRAVLVSLMDGKEEQIQTIESLVEPKAHNPREAKPGSRTGTVLVDVNKKIKQRRNQQLREFYEKVIHSINPDTSEIYIFGPSNTKKHFEKELKKHTHFCSVKYVTETADKMTRPQMVAQVKKHFQHNGHKS